MRVNPFCHFSYHLFVVRYAVVEIPVGTLKTLVSIHAFHWVNLNTASTEIFIEEL
jgi:hypothetical protein